MDNRTRKQKIECLVHVTETYYPWTKGEDKIIREEAEKLTDEQLTLVLEETEKLSPQEHAVLNERYRILDEDEIPKDMTKIRRDVANANKRLINELDDVDIKEKCEALEIPVSREALHTANEISVKMSSDKDIFRVWSALKIMGEV